jgi:hypothetical protein
MYTKRLWNVNWYHGWWFSYVFYQGVVHEDDLERLAVSTTQSTTLSSTESTSLLPSTQKPKGNSTLPSY